MFVVLRRPLIVLKTMVSPSRKTKMTDVCGSPSALVVARAARMLPLRANGQLGAAANHLGNDGAYYPFAIVVLATTSAHITRISVFA
jgi:hypothetical protein